MTRQQLHCRFKCPLGSRFKRCILWDREIEVHTNVDHDPAGPHHLTGKQTKFVFGLTKIAQFCHQAFGIKRPPFPVTVMPDCQSMGTSQLVTQGELHTDLQMVTGKTLVVGRRHLVVKRETGDPVRLCVPDAPGSGKILRWLNIVSAQRAPLRSKTHFDGSYLFRHVEHLVVQSLQGLLLNLTHPFQKGLWRIHAVAGIGLEQLNNLFETSTRPNPVAHSFHLLFELAT